MPFREIYLSQHKNRRVNSKATMPREKSMPWQISFEGVTKDKNGNSRVGITEDGFVDFAKLIATVSKRELGRARQVFVILHHLHL